MTQNRDLKQLIRERMAKTNEGYAAARRHILAQRRSVAPPPPPSKPPKLDLPTPDEFDREFDDYRRIKDGHDPGPALHHWAQQLGVGSECFCGERMLDPYGLAEGLVAHWKTLNLDEKKAEGFRDAQELGSKIFHSGVDCSDGEMCSYHQNAWNKDD